MLSGIIMLIIGPCILAYSVYRFLIRKNYTGVVYLFFALIMIAGGAILVFLSI